MNRIFGFSRKLAMRNYTILDLPASKETDKKRTMSKPEGFFQREPARFAMTYRKIASLGIAWSRGIPAKLEGEKHALSTAL